jgi:magnesium and cobalt transporter
VFIPESKPLNVLLKEFRKNRNHIAIVVDEYGGVAGVVTMEDVIEQIVGDIEDEYDFDDVEDNIVQEKGGQYRVKGLTEISDFNAVFGTNFSDDDHDTIGGLVMSRFGRVPKRGEQVNVDTLTFRVLRADGRRLHLLQVAKKKQG